MEAALTSLLLADAGLTALVGDRVHWLRLPQEVDVKPYINLQRVSGARDYTMAGASGYAMGRVQADVWGLTYGSVKATAQALLAALSGYRGPTIQGVFVESERDDTGDDAGGVNRLYRTSVDVIIHYTE